MSLKLGGRGVAGLGARGGLRTGSGDRGARGWGNSGNTAGGHDSGGGRGALADGLSGLFGTVSDKQSSPRAGLQGKILVLLRKGPVGMALVNECADTVAGVRVLHIGGHDA